MLLFIIGIENVRTNIDVNQQTSLNNILVSTYPAVMTPQVFQYITESYVTSSIQIGSVLQAFVNECLIIYHVKCETD